MESAYQPWQIGATPAYYRPAVSNLALTYALLAGVSLTAYIVGLRLAAPGVQPVLGTAIVTGIAFLVLEKENRFVRFHAMQSTLVFAGVVVIDILLQIVPLLGALVVVFVVIPASAVLWLVLMFKAYQGGSLELPWISRFAQKQA